MFDGQGSSRLISFVFLFFGALEIIFYLICTVAGCDGGNWSAEIALPNFAKPIY
jgi:hypothetical protein